MTSSFVPEVIALAIALNLILLLLVIGIAPIVRKLWKGSHGSDQKESPASFAPWAIRCFAKMTGIQVAWSIGAYIAFCLLNISQGKTPFHHCSKPHLFYFGFYRKHAPAAR